MRFLNTGLLVAVLSLPVAAQPPRFVKIDIQVKSQGLLENGRDGKGREMPENIEIRMPISLVKAALETLDLEGKEVSINGKEKKGIKVAQLVELLKESSAGDMLLEVRTSNGDMVKITLE
jgi:uncharacterized ubiquitin-like protein YukD